MCLIITSDLKPRQCKKWVPLINGQTIFLRIENHKSSFYNWLSERRTRLEKEDIRGKPTLRGKTALEDKSPYPYGAHQLEVWPLRHWNIKKYEINKIHCHFCFIADNIKTAVILDFCKSKYTAQKMKFSIKHFFSKWDQIRRKLRIWTYLLKKSLMKNFIFVQWYPASTPGRFILLILVSTENIRN